jgi:hypothetical protein
MQSESESEGILGGVGVGKNVPTPTPTGVGKIVPTPIPTWI